MYSFQFSLTVEIRVRLGYTYNRDLDGLKAQLLDAANAVKGAWLPRFGNCSVLGTAATGVTCVAELVDTDCHPLSQWSEYVAFAEKVGDYMRRVCPSTVESLTVTPAATMFPPIVFEMRP